MARTKTKARPALSRERVVQAALELVDREGVGALTMRRLGAALGVEAMSLYNHVKDKPSLLAAVLDQAASGFLLPSDEEDDWREWARAWMRCARRIFSDHPQLFHILLMNVPLGPHTLRMIDALFGRLERAGLDAEAQLRVWGVLKAYLFGTLIQDRIETGDMPAKELFSCCPNLVRVIPSYDCCDSDRLFEDGLELVLRGMNAQGVESVGAGS